MSNPYDDANYYDKLTGVVWSIYIFSMCCIGLYIGFYPLKLKIKKIYIIYKYQNGQTFYYKSFCNEKECNELINTLNNSNDGNSYYVGVKNVDW